MRVLRCHELQGVERSVLPMVVPTIELVEMIGESEACVALQPMPLLRGSRRLGDTATRFTLLVALPLSGSDLRVPKSVRKLRCRATF